MMHDTTQMTTILLRALLAVLLNISGWQIAYQRSWAMQLSVRTDTETEMVWGKKKKTHQLDRDESILGMGQKIDPIAYFIHVCHCDTREIHLNLILI